MNEREPYDEKRALELLAQGSEHAFAQIFDQYRPRIYRSALRFLKSPMLAEEIVQEVFMKVWKKRQEIAHVNNFSAYIFTIGRNLIFDSIKQMAEEAAAGVEYSYSLVHDNGTEKILLEQQYEELLRKAVDQLPPQQKQIFRLAKIEGLSHEAIARKLNLSRLTVKRHMATALHTIRIHLQGHLASLVLLSCITGIFGR